LELVEPEVVEQVVSFREPGLYKLEMVQQILVAVEVVLVDQVDQQVFLQELVDQGLL
tara:strand:+ start:294 stop:464 length:171 start_codon:yes stop_codon:yes gene_type:complete